MRIDVDSEEGRFLHAQLKRRISDLEADVEHADDADTQHVLLAEIARVEAIVMHVASALEVSSGADSRVSFETRM
jgi:hypothetical protein